MDEKIIEEIAKIGSDTEYRHVLIKISEARKKVLVDRVAAFYKHRLPHILKSLLQEAEVIHSTQLDLGAADEEISKTHKLICGIVELLEKYG